MSKMTRLMCLWAILGCGVAWAQPEGFIEGTNVYMGMGERNPRCKSTAFLFCGGGRCHSHYGL